MCGRVIQSIIEKTKQKNFSLNEWENLISEGELIDEIKSYPTTKRILTDFNKDNDIIKNSLSLFKEIILYEENDFKLDFSKPEIKFLSDEGLIISVGEIKENNFKITSPIIRDTFGMLLIKKSNVPNEIISLFDFKIENVIEKAIKYFDFKKLINCYEFCSKKNEDQKSYTCEGLNEATYQFELGSIFRNWFPIDINISVQATKKELRKYPDIFLSCKKKFKIILELLSNERYSHIKNKTEHTSSVLGHIERTINYGNKFKADPWIINFVTLTNIKDYDEIKYPGEGNNDYNNDINIVYIFHDRKFDNIKMKFTKINDKKSNTIDIIKKE